MQMLCLRVGRRNGPSAQILKVPGTSGPRLESSINPSNPVDTNDYVKVLYLMRMTKKKVDGRTWGVTFKPVILTTVPTHPSLIILY